MIRSTPDRLRTNGKLYMYVPDLLFLLLFFLGINLLRPNL